MTTPRKRTTATVVETPATVNETPATDTVDETPTATDVNSPYGKPVLGTVLHAIARLEAKVDKLLADMTEGFTVSTTVEIDNRLDRIAAAVENVASQQQWVTDQTQANLIRVNEALSKGGVGGLFSMAKDMMKSMKDAGKNRPALTGEVDSNDRIQG